MTGGPKYAASVARLVNLPHSVYIVWRGDEALYVGMTSDWLTRTAQHMHYFDDRGRATHIDVWEVADSRWDAEQLEAQMIRDLDPLDNVEHSPRAARRRAEWAAECQRFTERPDAYAEAYERKRRAVEAAAS